MVVSSAASAESDVDVGSNCGWHHPQSPLSSLPRRRRRCPAVVVVVIAHSGGRRKEVDIQEFNRIRKTTMYTMVLKIERGQGNKFLP